MDRVRQAKKNITSDEDECWFKLTKYGNLVQTPLESFPKDESSMAHDKKRASFKFILS